MLEEILASLRDYTEAVKKAASDSEQQLTTSEIDSIFSRIWKSLKWTDYHIRFRNKPKLFVKLMSSGRYNDWRDNVGRLSQAFMNWRLLGSSDKEWVYDKIVIIKSKLSDELVVSKTISWYKDVDQNINQE